MKKTIILTSAMIMLAFNVFAKRTSSPLSRTCTCSMSDNYDGIYAIFTLTYTSSTTSCNPCGASNMSLTLDLFDPGDNEDYSYTGTPTLYAINALCASLCTPFDWLIA